MTVAC